MIVAGRNKDPLWPLALLSNVLLTLLGIFLLLLAATTIWGSGEGMGFGGDSVCATTQPGDGFIYRERGGGAGDRSGNALSGPVGLTSQATFHQTEIEICLQEPTIGQRVIYGLSIWPEVLLFAGSLGLLRLIVGRAYGQGLFSRQVAQMASILGAVVLAGSLLVATIEAFARGALIAQALDDEGWTVGAVGWNTSISAVIGGIGIICVGRVLARAVAMQEDLDATI